MLKPQSSLPPAIVTGVIPKTPQPNGVVSSATLYQIVLALAFLYLVMTYAPGGKALGWLILFLVILETPDATSAFDSFVQFVQNPRVG